MNHMSGGIYRLKTWAIDGYTRHAPGSVVRLSAEDAESMLESGSAVPYEGPSQAPSVPVKNAIVGTPSGEPVSAPTAPVIAETTSADPAPAATAPTAPPAAQTELVTDQSRGKRGR